MVQEHEAEGRAIRRAIAALGTRRRTERFPGDPPARGGLR